MNAAKNENKEKKSTPHAMLHNKLFLLFLIIFKCTFIEMPFHAIILIFCYWMLNTYENGKQKKNFECFCCYTPLYNDKK